MIATEHTQSLSDFREKAVETLDRLNKTGEMEILTVDGEAQAVLLSPAVYDELAKESLAARDVAVMRRSIKELGESRFLEADVFFDGLYSQLLAMQAEPSRGTMG